MKPTSPMPKSATCHSSIPVLVGVGLLIGICAGSAAAEDLTVGRFTVQEVVEGSSDTAKQRLAMAGLPLANLAPAQRAEANRVLSNCSMFRRMPTYATKVSPDVYNYFVAHPDAAVGMWRAMGISKFQLTPTAPNEYAANSGDGSIGLVRVLHSTPESQLITMHGKLSSPLLVSPVKVSALMHLRTAWYRDADGAPLVSHRADLFVHFPSSTVATAAKLFAPVSRTMIDRNFQEITLFGNVMSSAMARRPEWVRGHLRKMNDVNPERVGELNSLTSQIHTQTIASGRPLSSRSPVEATPISASEESP